MPFIKYRAVDKHGSQKHGFTFAKSLDSLDEELKSKGIFPSKMDPLFSGGSWSLNQKQALFYELSSLVGSGVSLSDSLQIMGHEWLKEKGVLEKWHKNIHAGRQLSQCVGETTQVNSFIAEKMLEVGEQTGKLGGALQQLAHYFESLHKLKQKLISALIYPCIILTVSVIAILVLTLYVIPMFLSMFKRYHIELPGITKLLLAFTQFITDYVFFIALIIILMVTLIKVYHLFEKPYFFKLLKRIPIVGYFFMQYNKLTLLKTLANLLSSDIRVHEAISLLMGMFKDPQLNAQLSNVCEEITKGALLSDAFIRHNILSKRDLRLIQIGEETGNLSRQVSYLADYCERRLDQSMERIMSLFEPTMIILLSLVIGFVLVALYLPLFDILGGSLHR